MTRTDPPAAAPRRSRRWAKRLLALLVGLTVTALLAEGLVLVTVGEQPKFPRHVVGAPWGLRYNEPGASYRHKSADVCVHFRINAQGMRCDRPIEKAKPAGTKRIVALGDSFTIGYEVELPEAYPSIVERELTARGHRVEVLNAGVSGFSTAEQLLYLERELIHYAPDVVMVGFCFNDLGDNVRTGLFGLRDGALVALTDRYVPAGGLGDFLNQNAVFNFFSEYSNAFVLVKERLTHLMKRSMLVDNEVGLIQGASAGAAATPDPAALLCAALYERLYAFCQARGLPLVVVSIPAYVFATGEHAETFPLAQFSVARPGLHFIAAKPLLDPYVGKELTYYQRSHLHWTPLAHRVVGNAVAATLHDAGALPR